MCGIAGSVSLTGKKPEKRLIQEMTRSLAHRGPDGETFFYHGRLTFGHRRLALVDPVGGRQPMCDPERRYWVNANAEIYNHKSLRSRYGLEVDNRCDVGVLPDLYRKVGTEFLSLLDGMFALALWDTETETLLLARDSHGMKPLYYYVDEHCFLFASELKALLAYQDLDRTLCLKSLDYYCQFMTTLDPHCFLSKVKKLPPGCFLTLRDRELSVASYKPFTVDNEVNLDTVLHNSVTQTMNADTLLGVFLSGGLDSSLVAALAAKKTPSVPTFSIAFREKDYDESIYSRLVAERIESAHQEILFEESDAVRVALAVSDALDEPMGDSSALAVWLLAEAASRQVKGVLTGDGADELFGGYPWHRERPPFSGDLMSFITHPEVLLFDPEQRGELYRFEPADDLSLPHLNLEKLNQLSGQEASMEVDQATLLPSDLLVKIDRMTMAHSLEARIPYLNPSVVGAARCLPVRQRTQKRVLKETFGGLLPESVLTRRKKGFGVPVGLWAWKPGPFRELIYDTLTPPSAKIFDYLQIKTVQRYLLEHDRLPVHGHRLWCLFVLERWLRSVPSVPRCAEHLRMTP
jgi:asparagine synthase (glutamine-hydrolysing)